MSVAPGSETSGNLVSGEIEEENTDDVTELNLAGDGRGRKGREVRLHRGGCDFSRNKGRLMPLGPLSASA